jgi:hypothetical protein
VFFLAASLLWIAAAAVAVIMLLQGVVVFRPVTPERRGKAIVAIILFIAPAAFFAAAGGLFHVLDTPVAQIEGRINDVSFQHLRRGVRTDIYLPVSSTGGLGLSARGTNRLFHRGEYVVVRYQATNGNILTVEFRNSSGGAEGHYRSPDLYSPWALIFMGAVTLYFAFRITRPSSSAVRSM